MRLDVTFEESNQTLDVVFQENTTSFEAEFGETTYLSGTAYKIGEGLKLDEKTNTLSVDAIDTAIRDNTQPITSGGVYKEIGNINSLLETI